MKQIAILGFGTVGGGVADILRDNADVVEKSAGEAVKLKYIVDLRDMPESPYADKMVKNFDIVANDPEVDIVVEAIGGVGAALAMVRKALCAGKHVVTSNKQLVAEYGVELFALAREHGVNFLFEASVGGGIPALNPMTRCLGANHITGVAGILNGTTNFILTQMLEQGEGYETALREAQANGYAEANPAADVEGMDAARKICILAGLAFGENVKPEEIHVEGITRVTTTDAAFADAGGMKIKLLGRALVQDGKKFVFVSPHMVPGDQVLAAVGGVFNAIAVQGDQVGEVLFYVSSRKRWYARTANPKFHVVAIDCGMKLNIVRSLTAAGCNVTVVPYHTDAETIAALRPDGVFLSNGPGDPEDVTEVIETIRALRGSFPLFGICLGHQLIALAYGAKTYKLKFGHRGGNHPVMNLETGKIEMTSQNHSYAVDEDSLAGTGLVVTHRNLLDGTVEGQRCAADRVFSVQYHPESAPGPQDSAYLFAEFLQSMKEAKGHAETH